VPSGEISGNISAPRSRCWSRFLFLPENDSRSIWAIAVLFCQRSLKPSMNPRQSHSSFVLCCFSLADAPSAQPLDEVHGKFQPMPANLHVYVPDTDALRAQAVRTGAISVIPPPHTQRSLRRSRRHRQKPLRQPVVPGHLFRYGTALAARVNAPCPPRARWQPSQCVPFRTATLCPGD
jgi:hypothetical protein